MSDAEKRATWCFNDPRCLDPFMQLPGAAELTSIGASIDGRWLLVGDEIGRYAIIDTQSNRVVRTYESSQLRAWYANLLCNQLFFLANSVEGVPLRVPLPTDPCAIIEALPPLRQTTSLIVDAEGAIVFSSAQGDELLRLWNENTTHLLAAYNAPIHFHASSCPAHNLLAIVLELRANEDDGPSRFELVVLRVGEGELLRKRIGENKTRGAADTCFVQLDPNGQWVAVVLCEDSSIECWNLVTQEPMPLKKLPKETSVDGLATAPDGSALAALINYRSVLVWRINEEDPYAQLTATEGIKNFVWVGEQLYFLLEQALARCTASLRDVPAKHPAVALRVVPEVAIEARFEPADRTPPLQHDAHVRFFDEQVWSTDRYEMIGAPINHAVLSPDENTIALCDEFGALVLLNARTGTVLRTEEHEEGGRYGRNFRVALFSDWFCWGLWSGSIETRALAPSAPSLEAIQTMERLLGPGPRGHGLFQKDHHVYELLPFGEMQLFCTLPRTSSVLVAWARNAPYGTFALEYWDTQGSNLLGVSVAVINEEGKAVRDWNGSTTEPDRNGTSMELAIDPHARWVALAKRGNGGVLLWDPAENRQRQLLTTPSGSEVTRLCSAPNGSFIAASSADEVFVWNIEKKEPLQKLCDGWCNALLWSSERLYVFRNAELRSWAWELR